MRPFSVGRDVVVADVAVIGVRVQQRQRCAAVEAFERNVAAADDETIRGVQRHSADAATMLEHGADLPVARQRIDAAKQNVAEQQTALRVPHRPFDEAITFRQRVACTPLDRSLRVRPHLVIAIRKRQH